MISIFYCERCIMFKKENWENVLGRYRLIKELYIECEETDPSLKTNLQPLNEFRAALDHTYRIIDIEINGDNSLYESEFDKLNSHLRRTFFDVCDMLAINYRNKIVEMLKIYLPEDIETAIPEYYPQIRPDIEKIDGNIAEYRKDKGNIKKEETVVLNYYSDVIKLRDMYKMILLRIPSLKEIKKKKCRFSIFNWIVGIAGILSLIVAVIFEIFKC